jgi:hypothetical protein
MIPYSEEWYDQKTERIWNGYKVTLARRINLDSILDSLLSFAGGSRGHKELEKTDWRGSIDIDVDGLELHVKIKPVNETVWSIYELKFCPKCIIAFDGTHPETDPICDLGIVDQVMSS